MTGQLRRHDWSGPHGVPGGTERWEHGSYRGRRLLEAALLPVLAVGATGSTCWPCCSPSLRWWRRGNDRDNTSPRRDKCTTLLGESGMSLVSAIAGKLREGRQELNADDPEAELIRQQSEALQRYLELLTERVQRLQATEKEVPPADAGDVVRNYVTELLSHVFSGSPLP